jgi:Endonuclease/Exonuclease/phosphatase family
MNDNTGPDLLGICEVENKWVVDKLKSSLNNLQQPHTYEVIHHDAEDKRGIDVAFIYDSNKFQIEKNQTTGEDLVFSHVIVRRGATRDIVQVNFKTRPSDNKLVLIGNHWPSRSGGQYETEPYRIVAGGSLSYFYQRILEENKEEEGENTASLIMGDFNDEPFNRSITDYALATTSMLKVKLSREKPRLYNLMWPIMAKGIASFYYDNFPNLLDQFMVSKGILEGSKISYKENSTQIVTFPEMQSGQYKSPLKFGRPYNNSLNTHGFSDHFPISLKLEEIT